jgi:hypothetical protein
MVPQALMVPQVLKGSKGFRDHLELLDQQVRKEFRV